MSATKKSLSERCNDYLASRLQGASDKSLELQLGEELIETMYSQRAAQDFVALLPTALLARKFCSELRLESPRNCLVLQRLFLSCHCLGRASRECLLLYSALESFNEGLSVADTLESIGGPGWLSPDTVCDSLDDYAELLYYQNRLPEAEALLQHSIAQREHVGDRGNRGPGGNARKAALAGLLLGDVLRAQGKASEAVYHKAFLQAARDNSHGYKARMLGLQGHLATRIGDLACEQGDLERAVASWRGGSYILLHHYGSFEGHNLEARLLALGLVAREARELHRKEPEAGHLEQALGCAWGMLIPMNRNCLSPGQIIELAKVYVLFAELALHARPGERARCQSYARELLYSFADFLLCPPLRALVQQTAA